jgi:hypothetical protein
VSSVPIATQWKTLTSQLAKSGRILEVGDYTGQFTNLVLENGFDVTVLADNHASAATFHRLPDTGSTLKIVEGPLEGVTIDQCDHVFFHHNSFLEAINQLGLRRVLNRLHELSSAEAHICFEYPSTTMPLVQGVIFSGRINSIGDLECRHSRHEQDNEIHMAQIEYAIKQQRDFCYVRVPMRFSVPKLI